MTTIFGINPELIITYNIAILTIATIFFSLSNLGQTLRKSAEDSLNGVVESKDIEAKLLDEITTSVSWRTRSICSLVKRLGFTFRNCIYSALFAVIMLFLFIGLDNNSLLEKIYLGEILSYLILIFSIYSTYLFGLSVHHFKYIYHFDFIEHNNLLMYRDQLSRKRDYQALSTVTDTLKNNDEVKVGFIKRYIEYLKPINPFDYKKKQ